MRVALSIVVVALLGWLGWSAAQRVMARDGDEPERATAAATADAWALAIGAPDATRLVELASDRVDADALTATHAALLEALPAPPNAVVGSVAVADNEALATVTHTADLGGGAVWTWDAEVPLIRARGVWSVDASASAFHPALREGWRLRVEVLEATRAPVLDRLGRALSRVGTSVEVGVQPGRLPDRERLLPTIASVLPEAFDPLTDLLQREDLVADWYYPLVTVSSDRADEVWPDLLALPGLLRRDAESGVGAAVFAPELVGAVALDDAGERHGVTGLEEVFDDRLIGSPATEVVLVDPDGRDRETLFTHQDDAAPPLVTTIDRDVQRAVDDALIAVVDNVAVAVVDPGTAGVLAVASRPTTGYARALEGRYPPGAIAGLVPVAAAFDAGADLDQPVTCPQDAVVGGVRVTTRTAPPALEQGVLRDVLAGGCDVALARLGVDAGNQGMLDTLALLGLDAEPALPVPSSGWTWPPTPADNAAASAAVGHARVQASAVAVAGLAAAVARGAPAVPVVLADDVDTAPTPWPTELTTELRAVLRAAADAGTVAVPDVRVAGAAARAGGGVGGDPAPETGWWFGYIEGAGPDVAFAVVVEGDDGTRAQAIATRVIRELVG